MQFDQNPQDLLADEIFYQRASTGQRLANYLIDLVVFYIFMFVIGMVIGLVAPGMLTSFANDSSSASTTDINNA